MGSKVENSPPDLATWKSLATLTNAFWWSTGSKSLTEIFLGDRLAGWKKKSRQLFRGVLQQMGAEKVLPEQRCEN